MNSQGVPEIAPTARMWQAGWSALRPAAFAPQVHPDATLGLDASVVTIGAFDGVHKGHQALVKAAVDMARARAVQCVVYTFDPPPKVHFRGQRPLTSVAEKVQRLSALGVDHIVVASFNDAYRKRSAADFLGELSNLNPKAIWVGEDFKFGRGQEGNCALLAEHFKLRIISPVCCDNGEVISSTRLRGLRETGRISAVEQLSGWRLADAQNELHHEH